MNSEDIIQSSATKTASQEEVAQRKRAVNDLLTSTFNSILHIEERSLNGRLTAGLTISELHTICAVGMYDKTPTSVVAERLGVTTATVTVAANKLVSKGFLERLRSETDKRQVLLHATQTGRKALRAHNLFHRKMIDDLFEDLSDQETLVLMKAAHGIKDFFDRENEASLAKAAATNKKSAVPA